MAVGEIQWSDLAPVRGLRLGVAEAGIKYPNRKDVGVILLDEGARVAGVFTQNAFAAAPVILCRDHLSKTSEQRALIVNSGNANACTGEVGVADAIKTCEYLADILSVDPKQILPFSTGVIGEPLPIEKLSTAMPSAVKSAEENAWEMFARAIMTTDTRPKGASVSFEWQGDTINISGVAKGAGMINPNMATMLAFVAMDASVSDDILKDISLLAAQKSFNRITIDGDTSTNDSCVLIATGKVKTELDSKDDELFLRILDSVTKVYQSLAQQIVKDGEGATKFVEINVEGGKSAQESLNVAYAMAHSPLVKTALYASDPNWGRLVAAIGYADVESLDAQKVRVWLDELLIVDCGGKASQYTEEQGQVVLDKECFSIRVDLGRGSYNESLWTSDLSHEYIRINAEYRS